MKDDIDKIDEQIQSILDTEKKDNKSKEKKEEAPVEEIEEGDTKKIDNLKEMESLESEEEVEESEEEKEETKKVEEVPAKEVDKIVDEDVENTFFSDVKKGDIKGNNTILYILIGIIVVLLIAFGLYFFKDKLFGKGSKSDQKEVVDYEQELKNYGDALKAVLAVHYQKDNKMLEYEDAIEFVNFDYDVECATHFIYDDGTVFLDNCTIDGHEVESFYGQKKKEKKVIPAGNVKIYVPKDTGVATFEEPKDGIDYDIFAIDIKEKYQDLSFLNAKTSDYVYYVTEEEKKYSATSEYTYKEYAPHVVNYKTGEKALSNISHESVIPIKIGDNTFDDRYVAVSRKDGDLNIWGFYDLKNNKKTIDFLYNGVGVFGNYGVSDYPNLVVRALDRDRVVVYSYSDNVPRYGIVDYTNGKYTVPFECSYLSKSGDYVFCVNVNGNDYIADYEGNKYLDGTYNRIYGAVDGKFILVQDKENVKLVNMKGTVLYNYGKNSFDKPYYSFAYDDGAIFTFQNTKDSDNYYKYAEEECLEVVYSGKTKTGEIKGTYCGGIAKPILYLYPEKETNVTVTFAHPELLETTYPKFINSWNVVAHPNGDLYDKDGKYYYGLYWDEKKVHSVDFKEGFYVEGDKAISFLEEKLDIIGLNAKEKNEFIMYWLPILEKNKKSLVYFELTEERESVNKININPKPDSLLRLVIHVKKVNKKVSIKEEKLNSFNRHGFVAVEWGGTTY